MSSEELNVQDYVMSFLNEMNFLYDFKDKTVMFMFYQPDIDNAKAVKSLGARKVYYVNPDEITVSDDEDIICLNSQPESFPDVENGSVDLIIGLEILEHINNLKQFFGELKRILASDGNIELQGNPMWTSHFGHHLWIEDKFIFYDETNPFEPWEHLVYKTKDEYYTALKDKGISPEDSREIISWIYNDKEISRHTPTEIIEAASGIKNEPCKELNKASYSSAVVESYKIDGWRMIFKKYYDKTETNEFFEKAKEFYTEEDLKTQRVVLRMRADEDCELHCSRRQYVYDMPLLPQHIADILYPFFKKHDMKNKRVLNLCLNNNELISQAFMAQGAKLVYAVSPLISHKQKTGPIKTFCTNFEDVNLWEFYRFDVIFFMDTLYNFKGFDKFLENLKQVVKDDTIMYIMGYMPYSSHAGHLVYTDEHRFSDETCIFEPWEHLAYETKEEFEAALKAKNIPDYEIDEISEVYFTPSKVLKYSPTELLEKFKQVKDMYLYRIYKYVPKNKYYEIAEKKYPKEDLDVERMIFSTDFPEKLYFDELDIDTYLQDNLADINRKYNFKGKKVLNLTPFINNILTDGIESLGVDEVVAMTSHYSGFELQGGLHARRVNQAIEDLDNIDDKFDIIYGLDVLEHVKDLRKFYANLIRLVDDNGVICIQGSPLWPSDNGHNFMDGLDCGKLRTGLGNKRLEPWEHLAYNTKEELKEAMLKKKFTVHDAETVSEYIFNSDKINRLSFIDFLEVLDEFDNVFYGHKKILHYTEENEFYRIANEKYTHEELRTKELKLFIRKKLS